MNATKKSRRDRLLAALLTANSLKDAAAAADVPYDTARRWMRDPDFQAVLADLRRDAADAAVLEALRLAELARATLADILADEHAAAYVRVRAAEVVLTYERAVSDLYDLNERLAAIEARLAEHDTPNQPTYPAGPNGRGIGYETK